MRAIKTTLNIILTNKICSNFSGITYIKSPISSYGENAKQAIIKHQYDLYLIEYIDIGDTMKRYIFLLIGLYFITGCFVKTINKENIDTIIEENKNILVGINYPVTGIKKLDKILQKDIEEIYTNFKNEYESYHQLDEQSELNMDYTYELVSERYINITMHIFINSSTLANPINYMKSYVYDKNQNKLLTIHDLISEEDFEKFVSLVRTKLIQKYKDCILLDSLKSTVSEQYNFPLFTIDYDTLSIYFNPTEVAASYCDILDIDIPFHQLKIKIPIHEEEKTDTTVKLVAPIKVIDPKQKVVALTFDDGPSKYTEEILEILRENNAYGTFFVIGNKVEIYKETMQKMVSYGNEIGNHSYNHKWLTKLTESDLQEQITKTQDIIYSVTGYTPTIIRPTYGSVSNKLQKQLSLDIVMWTVDTSDWKYKSTDRIVKEATSKTKDLDIILMHDTHKRTAEALKKIIPELQRQGFKFVTVSELKEIKKLREQMH